MAFNSMLYTQWPMLNNRLYLTYKMLFDYIVYTKNKIELYIKQTFANRKFDSSIWIIKLVAV
jgi:hypothetical protein